MSEKPVWQGEKESVLNVLCFHDFQILKLRALQNKKNVHDFPHRRCYHTVGQTVLFSWQKQMYQGNSKLDLKAGREACCLTVMWFTCFLPLTTAIPVLIACDKEQKHSPQPTCTFTRMHTFFFPPLSLECSGENKTLRLCYCQVIFNNNLL